MMRRAVVVGGLVSGIAISAHAQASLSFVDADRETVAQLTRIVESVKAANLPTDPVVAKASLAARFHTPPAQMIAAVQAVATHLMDARDALGPEASTADVMAGADALRTKGVTKEMLRRMQAAQAGRSIAVPMGVIAQLVASGVAPNEALDIVSRLVRGKASNAQLVSLGNEVSQDVMAGAGAGYALQIRLEMLKPLLAYGAPAAATGQGTDLPAAGGSGTGPKSPQNPRGRP
jgi:hypothetical protein